MASLASSPTTWLLTTLFWDRSTEKRWLLIVSSWKYEYVNGSVFVLPLPSTVLAPTLLPVVRSEEHTSELQSLMRISYAVFCLKKKNDTSTILNPSTDRCKK